MSETWLTNGIVAIPFVDRRLRERPTNAWGLVVLGGTVALAALMGVGCAQEQINPASMTTATTSAGPADLVPIPGTTAEHVYSPDRKWHAYILWHEGYGELLVEGPNAYKKAIGCGLGLASECNPNPIAFSIANLTRVVQSILLPIWEGIIAVSLVISPVNS